MGGFSAVASLEPRAPSPAPPIANPLDEYGRVVQLQGAQQEMQARSLQMQIQQQQLQDQQAMTAAYKQMYTPDGKPATATTTPDGSSAPSGGATFKPQDFVQRILANGGSGQAAQAAQKNILAMQDTASQINQRDADTGSKNTETAIKKQGQLHDLIQGLQQLANDPSGDIGSLNQAYQNAIPKVRQLGGDVSQLPTQFTDLPSAQQALAKAQMTNGLWGHVLQDQKEQAQTSEANASAAKSNAAAALDQIRINLTKNSKPGDFDSQIDAIASGPANTALNSRTKAMVNFALSRGDIDSANSAIKMAAEQVASIEKETNPVVQAAKLHLAAATKAAEQAISDGDPRAAAQLLFDGDVAPSQLISSRKPAFAQQAFSIAQQMQPGWNAQKAEADFNVAKSPTNLAFFGSAKSLTDPGGTLDQLKAAAKDIPQNQFPVFNSVADWYKAATGSGPIAKYAALALGVADDYSKVMGGGQGSDTSRQQALNLIAAKQSPEQRDASLDGIRGAVSSQTHSRIGGNPVMQKMYGSFAPSPTQQGQSAAPATSKTPPPGATHTATGSDGHLYYTNQQGQVLGRAD